MAPFLADLAAIDGEQDLRAVVGDVVAVLQERFRGVFDLMTRMGMIGPPKSHRHTEDDRRAAREGDGRVARALRRGADLPAVPPRPGAAHGDLRRTHPHLTDGRPLTAAEIVTLVLDGVEKKDS